MFDDSMISELAKEVKADIVRFIEQQAELLFNEFDFQMQLALALRASGKYDDVDAEYFLPNSVVEGYDWDSNMYLDIVVSRDGEFVPVELKYCTRSVRCDILRFNELLQDVEIMRNQGAQDNRRYDFWKDVRRVELVKKLFPAVKNGLAVFLTNDPAYTRSPRPGSSNAPFSMATEHIVGGGTMDWIGNPSTRNQHMPFKLEGSYRNDWHMTTIGGVGFYYTSLTV